MPPFDLRRRVWFGLLAGLLALILVILITLSIRSPRRDAQKPTRINNTAEPSQAASPSASPIPSATTVLSATTIPSETTIPEGGNAVSGTIYYVSPDGDDRNPGTANAPFQTLNLGVSVLQAGDTLYVRSGTYLLNRSLIVSQSGTAQKPITIMTAPKEPSLAVISGDLNGNKIADPPGKGDAPVSPDYHFIRLTGSYIHFRNFEIAFSTRKGIVSSGSYNLISGNNVHNTQSAGINIHGPHNTVENNSVWRTVESNNCPPPNNPYGSGLGASRKCKGDWSSGIAWGDTSGAWNPAPNAIIRHNLVFHNSGEGLLCMNTDGAVVEENIVYDNWALGIDLDQCSNTLIQKNLVFYSADKTWWRGSDNPGHAIMLSNEGILSGSPMGSNRKVINNIIIGSNIRYWGRATGSALKNDLIANNTIVESQGLPPFDIDAPVAPAVHINTRFLNNLVLQTSGPLTSIGAFDGLTFDYNLWSGNNSIVAGPNDVIGIPLLAAPAVSPCTLQIDHPDAANPRYEYHRLTCVPPDGIKLTPDSPAKNKGENLIDFGVLDDYFKIKRPRVANFSIGAQQ